MRRFTVVLVLLTALLAVALVCGQTTAKPQCQVRSCTKRDKVVCATNGRRQCRLLKNTCELQKLNCNSIQKWNPTKKKRCRKNKIGAGPKKC